MTDRVLGDPWFWGRAWERLSEFKTTSLVDLSILDFNLLANWLEHRETLRSASPYCYYIDMRTLENIVKGSSENFLKTNLSLSECSKISKKPVILLLGSCTDYETPILLVLNYDEGKALLLGTHEETQRFDAPKWLHDIWTAVGHFFGWDCSNSSVSTIILRWIPVRIGSPQCNKVKANINLRGGQNLLKKQPRWLIRCLLGSGHGRTMDGGNRSPRIFIVPG